MKGFQFFAEMPEGWRSKSGCKTHAPFTRKTLKEWASRGVTCNVNAVFIDEETGRKMRSGSPGTYEALVATFGHSDSDTSVGAVGWEYLDKRCVRIDEATARKLHPRLFARLDAAEG
jgi:hypothetical protein